MEGLQLLSGWVDGAVDRTLSRGGCAPGRLSQVEGSSNFSQAEDPHSRLGLISEQLGAFGHVIYHQEPMIPYLQNRSMGSAFYHILKCMYGIAWHLGSVQKC